MTRESQLPALEEAHTPIPSAMAAYRQLRRPREASLPTANPFAAYLNLRRARPDRAATK